MAKLLVIGGGPAGLFAALEAADRGLDVTLMEKGKIGEDIRCAEGFFDVLKLLGKPCAGVRFKVETLIFKARDTYTFDAGFLNLWMIDRSTWQTELSRKAREKGVDIRENSPVTPKELKELKAQYDYIIDASGAPSVTSRAFGFSNFYKSHSAKTVQYTMQGDFSHLGKSLKAGFLPDFWGYYWIFPKGKDEHGRETANVGIGNFNPGAQYKLWEMLDDVLKKEKLNGEDYKIIGRAGGICPYLPPDKLAYDNILLVGDAAGLTSPLHGGGIDMAVISGITAAKALGEDPRRYEADLKKLLNKRLRIEGLIAKEWSKSDFTSFNHMLKVVYKFRLYKLLSSPRLINPITIGFIRMLL